MNAASPRPRVPASPRLDSPAWQPRLFSEPTSEESPVPSGYRLITEGCPQIRFSDLPPLYAQARGRCRCLELSHDHQELLELVGRQWATATTDPYLYDCTERHCDLYLNWLRGRKLALETIRTRCRYCRILLHFARPQGEYQLVMPEWPFGLYGFYCLQSLPLPPQPRNEPRMVSPASGDRDERPCWGREELSLFLKVCDQAKYPTGEGFSPEQWWRSILDVAAGTGLRRRTLWLLQRSWFSPDGTILTVPADSIKSRRRTVIYCSDLVRRAVAAMPTGERVFPLPASIAAPGLVHKEFRRLTALTEIPESRRYRAGFHSFRRGLGDRLWIEDPQDAKETLGHRSEVTTREHYSNMVRRAQAAGQSLETVAAEILAGR